MKKILLILILIFLFLLIGCQSKDNIISEDIKFRVEILYDHTIQMEDFATPEEMQLIELDMSKISPTDSIIKMIEQMESAYNISPNEDYETRIVNLENRMNEMMKKLYKLYREG